MPSSQEDAAVLARKMEADLRPHIKDRKWRLKSYKQCFTADLAVAWAMSNVKIQGASDDLNEEIAIQTLNAMIDGGMICHVVDPQKRFQINETRVLYFRFTSNNPEPRGAHGDVCWDGARPLGTSPMSSPVSEKATAADLSTRIDELENSLRRIRGKAEFLQQQVTDLAAQQMLCHVVMLFVAVLSICSKLERNSIVGTLFVIIGLLSLRSVSFWNHVPDISPFDDDDLSLEETSIMFSDTQSQRRLSAVVAKSVKSLLRGSMERSESVRGEHMREACTLPDVAEWPHRPLLVCANTPVSSHFKVADYGSGPCPLGRPFRFESDLFEGVCLIRVKNSNSDDIPGDASYFKGRKRIFQSVVQGRFKKAIPVSDVMTGHEFSRPLSNLPPHMILKTASSFIEKLSPGSTIAVHGDSPFVEVCLASSSQVIRGDQPGNEPNILTQSFEEDCSVFGGKFASSEISPSRRKRIFSSMPNSYMFDSQTVYTFDFYQNLFDAQSYALDLGFAKIACASILDGQPIQWLGKTRDGIYLWSFQIWNENLLSE